MLKASWQLNNVHASNANTMCYNWKPIMACGNIHIHVVA